MDYPNQTSSALFHSSEPLGLNLLDYLRVLVSQYWLIIGVAIGATSLALGVSLLLPQKFRATATLQIERDVPKVMNVDNLIPVESPLDRDFYQTQYQLLQSRSLARAVIRKMNLDREPMLKPLVDKVLSKVQNLPVNTRNTAIESALIEMMLNSLKIEPILNSRLVYVHFDSHDPTLSAKVANAYAKMFIENNQQRRSNAFSFAMKYLSGRLEQLRIKVDKSERNVVAYSTDEKIVSVGDEKPSLSAQNLSDLNALLASAQNERIRAEASWRQASIGDGLSIPQVLSNLLVQSLRTEQANMVNEYQQKLSMFKPEYPEMQRLKARIKENTKQINAEVLNIRQSLKSQYEAALRQENLLNDRIAVLEKDELDLKTRLIRYNLLEREAETDRQLYDALLQRYKEISVLGDVGSNNVTVVDAADIPSRPISPNLLMNTILGGIFGVFLGLTVAMVRYSMHGAKRINVMSVE
ncbi:polysaccharide biosynthesis protein GumC [Xylella fastidiosa subsp. pauca]|uniref:GumC family protein n=1 Tax=Xylella fastidiosa TaxID=2371 RepID=UPI0005834D30|nr:GumC family protein [Xylella fastidiosa]ARO68185.1 polysaccharide biosynthesis protein GumC [Xylella fastidiosa subsp. pauca]AVI20337.1 polysaccharide biosynthesis protein GumC [Xylella fastidiosa]AVI22345.1 polysaccharide biosynthesis protein GumC [Xylella fastidiosa]KIA57584.1 polysaccharide biosynthesis protein GumC [Xylella fastidiosa]KXB12503.1 polysaccharide biosynthesis protein GumC [Xylella fastidiosa]